MDKKILLMISKWAAIFLLASFNFISYLTNKTLLNLILVVVIFLYSVYEFFQILSSHKLHLGIKMYLFSFYLFAVISFVMGLRSFANGSFNPFFMSLLFIGGDIVLIKYTIHKLSEYKK